MHFAHTYGPPGECGGLQADNFSLNRQCSLVDSTTSLYCCISSCCSTTHSCTYTGPDTYTKVKETVIHTHPTHTIAVNQLTLGIADKSWLEKNELNRGPDLDDLIIEVMHSVHLHGDLHSTKVGFPYFYDLET